MLPSIIVIWWFVLAVLIAIAFSRLEGIQYPVFGGIFCFWIVIILLSAAGAFSSGFHICKKCGNTRITSDNVRNYPENDRSILDTPYEKTCKAHRRLYLL